MPKKISLELCIKTLVEAISKALENATPWTYPMFHAKSHITGEVKEVIDRKIRIRHHIDRQFRKISQVPKHLREDLQMAKEPPSPP